jgi:hypothetical protein
LSLSPPTFVHLNRSLYIPFACYFSFPGSHDSLNQNHLYVHHRIHVLPSESQHGLPLKSSLFLNSIEYPTIFLNSMLPRIYLVPWTTHGIFFLDQILKFYVKGMIFSPNDYLWCVGISHLNSISTEPWILDFWNFIVNRLVLKHSVPNTLYSIENHFKDLVKF